MVYEGPETQTHLKSKTVTDQPLDSSRINVLLEDLCDLKKTDGGGGSLVSCPTRLITYFTTQTAKKYCTAMSGSLELEKEEEEEMMILEGTE